MVVLLGSSVQRLAGIGFALVAAPVLVLLLGPGDGVTLANLASGVISAIGLAGAWRQVRPGAMLPLIAAAACTVPAGSWVAAQVPEAELLLVIGGLVSAAVLLVIRGVRVAALRGVGGALAAGATSGFMNSAAGVGGPAVSLYAVNTGWTAREFVPNAQLYGVVVNSLSLTAKGVPHLAAPAWATAAAAIAGGTALGHALADRVPEHRARRVVLGLALAGGLATLAKGLTGLLR
ncbi:membrane protein [Streptomyces rubellomurinus subsp. indigoferus]|uniref:Probable membrane transporter protein n=1 Tax=Streptomyces rubellomurinus (strain ATCC 31215) TaxID=359131 RepID=A0A0F2TMR9_STRR3|nr:membrane protein [Streptomyces rubellomurinus subsp. indigoferus]KJS63022.1 membrane protein [Streptomyces rubellomurinus]